MTIPGMDLVPGVPRRTRPGYYEGACPDCGYEYGGPRGYVQGALDAHRHVHRHERPTRDVEVTS